jgi:hypothetical protein
VSGRSTMAGSRRVGGAGVYEASYSLLHTGHMHLRASAAELPPLSSDCHRRRHVRWTNLWSPLHSHGDTSSPCELPSKQKRQSASSSESASSCEDIREGGRKQVETNQLFVCEQTTNKSSDTQSNHTFRHIHYNVDSYRTLSQRSLSSRAATGSETLARRSGRESGAVRGG